MLYAPLAPVHSHRSLWMMQNGFFLFPLSYRLPADHRVVQGGFSSEGGSGGFDSSAGTFSIATILRDTWTTVGTAEPCNCINTATPGERNNAPPFISLIENYVLKGSLWALMVPWGSFKIHGTLQKRWIYSGKKFWFLKCSSHEETNGSFKSCSRKGSLGNQKKFFCGIAVETTFWNLHF